MPAQRSMQNEVSAKHLTLYGKLRYGLTCRWYEYGQKISVGNAKAARGFNTACYSVPDFVVPVSYPILYEVSYHFEAVLDVNCVHIRY